MVYYWYAYAIITSSNTHSNITIIPKRSVVSSFFIITFSNPIVSKINRYYFI